MLTKPLLTRRELSPATARVATVYAIGALLFMVFALFAQ